VIFDDAGDQLWLGHTRIVTATERAQIPTAIATALKAALEKDVLKRERKTILQLRHPRHLSDHDLGRAMAANGKVEDLLSVMHVPILIAYDSDVLSAGFTDDYVSQLRNEAEALYEAVKIGFASEFLNIKIHIFLVPIECADTLTRTFDAALRRVR
jgi:hypothetical protein